MEVNGKKKPYICRVLTSEGVLFHGCLGLRLQLTRVPDLLSKVSSNPDLDMLIMSVIRAAICKSSYFAMCCVNLTQY